MLLESLCFHKILIDYRLLLSFLNWDFAQGLRDLDFAFGTHISSGFCMYKLLVIWVMPKIWWVICVFFARVELYELGVGSGW